jgi:hypothetical protein
MAKFIWIGVGVLFFGAAVGGYILNSGAPPIPKGGCPAAVSLAPYDSDVVAYMDFATLRKSVSKSDWDTLSKMRGADSLNQFVAATNFHLERDLDHIMFAAAIESSAGGLVLDGRFDQAKLDEFLTKSGANKHHFESGDVYLFSSPSPAGSFAVAFLGPNRLAIAGGKAPETQILVMADAARNPDPAVHEDLCARTARVSGAPVFLVGGVPKSTTMAMAALAAPKDSGFSELVQGLQGWDMGVWSDGDKARIAIEGEYDSSFDALKARFAFQKILDTIKKAEADEKSKRSTDPSEKALLDAFSKNFAITLDGRYVRMGTSITQSDMKNLVNSASTPSALPPPRRY